MKEIFKKIVIFILTLEAKLVLIRFKPKIISIAGSVGKTSSKDAIFAALSDSLHIRKNQKSFNSEIGVPLTILGLDNAYNNPFLWFKNILEGLIVIFQKDYPKWLVLETGVDRPGDMDKLTKWIKVDVAIFTRLPNVPAHVEYFSSPEEYSEEEKKLMKAVKPDGFVILNADDLLIMEIKNQSKNKVLTYGIENDADIKATFQEIFYENTKPVGVNFKIQYKENLVPVKLRGVLGNQHVYPVAASVAVAISQNISIIESLNSFEKYKAPVSRMNLLEGVKGSTIIDDSYNASPIAMQEALKVLSEIETTGKRIAVLGDMSEIGRYTANEHKIIGKMVTDKGIDLLFTLGKRAEFIAEEAQKTGMSQDKVFEFKEFGELTKELKEQIGENDVILVKGSQVVRTEKIVKQIMATPEKASELICRQDHFWLS